MKRIHTLTALTVAVMATSAWAANEAQHHSQPLASTSTVLVAQMKPGPGPAGMPAMQGPANMDAQMKAMQEMHAKMVAAKTPEQRNALMAEQMKVMQNGMSMMGRMGRGAMKGEPGDAAQRMPMLEQRMDMMQSMMQMMMDRMPSTPATK